VHVIAYYIGASHGVNGVAEWYFYASVLTGIPLIICAGKLVRCSPLDLLKSVWRPMLVALIMCISTHYAFTITNAHLDIFTSFILAVFFGGFIYLVFFYLLFPSLIKTYLSKVFTRKG